MRIAVVGLGYFESLLALLYGRPLDVVVIAPPNEPERGITIHFDASRYIEAIDTAIDKLADLQAAILEIGETTTIESQPHEHSPSPVPATRPRIVDNAERSGANTQKSKAVDYSPIA